MLMNLRKIPEHEAYAEMRRAAMNQNRRIADIAEAIITARSLLGGTH
jgi:response regulator NasT